MLTRMLTRARDPGADTPGEPVAGRTPLSLLIAVIIAEAAIATTFRGPRDRFWTRMTRTGAGLGAMALTRSGAARRTRIGSRSIVLGLASAAVLYVAFRAGDRFARRFVPGGDAQIRELYALRTLRPQPEIAIRLAAVIAPAEELFWRGLIQEVLMARYGRWTGAALAATTYAAAHVVSGNLTLVGAAGVAGAHWCALYAAGVPLGALVVSHVAWDLWIILIRPTGEVTVVARTLGGERPVAR